MVLILLLAVLVSGFIVRLLPLRIPLPLLQIALGAVLSYVFHFDVAFEPHLFLLLFIPPLLFLDGWRIPKGAFFRDWKPILMLAVGLVLFTVAGMGLFLHWLLPAVPLAVAFALAAILSPTDPVAVAAMTANAPLPSRLSHMLEGESLLNDATGLVAFSFAVTAAVTGVFSFTDATLSFVLVAGGGVLAGVVVTVVIGRLNRWLVKRTGEEPATQILVSLLVPFAAYMAAEHFHVSGILAAAVAGIAMHYTELSGAPMAATRMQRTAVWDTVQFILNGIIFVMLGEQLPRMLRDLPRVAAELGADSALEVLGYVVVITLALGLLRFAWVGITMRLTSLRRSWVRGVSHGPQIRLMLVTAAAGARGAITLAGILTLPLLMADGTVFPARDALIFLAMGVILLSLLIASVVLPPLAARLAVDLPTEPGRTGEGAARIAATEAAIRCIEQRLAEPPADPQLAAVRAEAGAHLLDVFQRRLQYGDPSGETMEDMQAVAEAERSLRLEAIRAARRELLEQCRVRLIDDDVYRRLMRELDLQESSLETQPAAH